MRALALLLALLASGCSGPSGPSDPSGPAGFTTLAVQLVNHGSTPLDVPVTVTGPDGARLLDATVPVPAGGKVVGRRVAATQAGAYAIHADDDHERVNGNGVQRVSDSRQHTLQTTDCATPVAAVLFSFANTQEGASQRWSNQGSRGFCLDA